MEEILRHEAPICIGSDHPALPGHFPGRPVVPGVVVLDQLVQAAEAGLGRPLCIVGLAQAKFLAPLLPEERARCSLQIERARLRFRVERGGRLLVQGAFALAAEGSG